MRKLLKFFGLFLMIFLCSCTKQAVTSSNVKTFPTHISAATSTPEPLATPTPSKEVINAALAEKLDKVKQFQEREDKKTFFLCAAQDELEHYTWGEDCLFPDIWRQAYLEYNLNGSQIMNALQSDVDNYISFGDSKYSLLWASTDVIYEGLNNKEYKAKLSEQEYKKITDNLNSVKKRLGVIYLKREYATSQ